MALAAAELKAALAMATKQTKEAKAAARELESALRAHRRTLSEAVRKAILSVKHWRGKVRDAVTYPYGGIEAHIGVYRRDPRVDLKHAEEVLRERLVVLQLFDRQHHVDDATYPELEPFDPEAIAAGNALQMRDQVHQMMRTDGLIK